MPSSVLGGRALPNWVTATLAHLISDVEAFLLFLRRVTALKGWEVVVWLYNGIDVAVS